MNDQIKPYECAPENAPKMKEWLARRGGIAIWESINLSNPGASWSTPALREDGSPMAQPTWEAAKTPSRVITDEREIVVVTRKEVKRFRVAIRRAGLSFKCTDKSSKRIQEALAKAGKDASYHFDYEEQKAVITVPGESVSLADFKT